MGADFFLNFVLTTMALYRMVYPFWLAGIIEKLFFDRGSFWRNVSYIQKRGKFL